MPVFTLKAVALKCVLQLCDLLANEPLGLANGERPLVAQPGHRGSCVLKAIFRRVLAGGGWQTGCMEFPQESNVAVVGRAKKSDNTHYTNDFTDL